MQPLWLYKKQLDCYTQGTVYDYSCLILFNLDLKLD